MRSSTRSLINIRPGTDGAFRRRGRRGLFVLVQGKVKIFKLSTEGKEQILHFVGQGESFGEVRCFPAAVFRPMQKLLKKAVFSSSRGRRSST